MKLGLGLFGQQVAATIEAAAAAGAATPATHRCFHCALPLPVPVTEAIVFDGISRPLCSAGCLGAAELLIGHGFLSYYRDRWQ